MTSPLPPFVPCNHPFGHGFCRQCAPHRYPKPAPALPPLSDAAREAAAVRIADLYSAAEDAQGCDTGVMWEEFSTLYTTLTGRPLGFHPDDLGNMDAEYDALHGGPALPEPLAPEAVTYAELAELVADADEAGSVVEVTLHVPIGGGWDLRRYIACDMGTAPAPAQHDPCEDGHEWQPIESTADGWECWHCGARRTK